MLTILGTYLRAWRELAALLAGTLLIIVVTKVLPLEGSILVFLETFAVASAVVLVASWWFRSTALYPVLLFVLYGWLGSINLVMGKAFPMFWAVWAMLLLLTGAAVIIGWRDSNADTAHEDVPTKGIWSVVASVPMALSGLWFATYTWLWLSPVFFPEQTPWARSSVWTVATGYGAGLASMFFGMMLVILYKDRVTSVLRENERADSAAKATDKP